MILTKDQHDYNTFIVDYSHIEGAKDKKALLEMLRKQCEEIGVADYFNRAADELTDSDATMCNLLFSARRIFPEDNMQIMDRLSSHFLTAAKRLDTKHFVIAAYELFHVALTSDEVQLIMLEEFQSRASKLPPFEIINLLWSLTSGNRVDYLNLLNSVFPIVNQNKSGLLPSQTTTVLYCMAKCNNVENLSVFNEIVEYFRRQTMHFTRAKQKDVCVLLWALAVFEVYKEDIWVEAVGNIFANKHLLGNNPPNQGQVVNALRSLQIARQSNLLDWKQEQAFWDKIDSLLDESKPKFFENRLIARQKNFQHRIGDKVDPTEVYSLLRQTGLKVIPEQIVDMYNIDYVIKDFKFEALQTTPDKELWKEKLAEAPAEVKHVPCDKTRDVLVEVDGPNHFVGGSQRLQGGTLMKRRNLSRLGYRLIFLTSPELREISRAASPSARWTLFCGYLVDKLKGLESQ
eukprot:TRINITY_DN4636_c0_g1_i10.p1 TRINITY_DN4636_c0_g1~~TRINITY_DN4636_c0_g1_i10.p1  ORF type:complete len:459 (+),score=86.78 TRINITY_DN4636_c0_g1_i10:111-1487(+)